MKVIWSPLAIQREIEIAKRIAEDRPEAAERWTEEIFDAVKRLELFPRSGRAVAEAEDQSDLREIVHGDFRIIHRVEPERVLVLTVRHTRQLTTSEDLDL